MYIHVGSLRVFKATGQCLHTRLISGMNIPKPLAEIYMIT